MVQDLMRTGPRGSSDQAPYLGPTRFYMTFGCDWRVVAIEVKVTTLFVSPDMDMDIGVAGTAATLTSIVNNFASGSATSAAGTILNVPLNGAATDTTFGITNGPLVATNTQALNGGAYQVTVLAEPVSGPYFSNK